jgi:hypothetical protein
MSPWNCRREVISPPSPEKPTATGSPASSSGAPGRTRTCDARFRKLVGGSRGRSWWLKNSLCVAKPGKACPCWSSEKRRKKPRSVCAGRIRIRRYRRRRRLILRGPVLGGQLRGPFNQAGYGAPAVAQPARVRKSPDRLLGILTYQCLLEHIKELIAGRMSHEAWEAPCELASVSALEVVWWKFWNRLYRLAEAHQWDFACGPLLSFLVCLSR